MKRDYIISFVIFIFLLIVQVTLIPIVSIGYFTPDLILILLVYYTLINGQLYGVIFGALFGLSFDLASGGILGVTMFAKTLAGFIAGYFYNENKIETNISSLNFSLIVFLAAFIDSFFTGFLSGMEEYGIVYIIFERSMFPAIYTAVVSLVVVLINPRRIL
jgi:rod shape-determining protein MreD